jgi:twitching motility protein PilU
VIFIGEIRDKDTMSQAIAYAQSGHLCMATLHANNSYHAMSRIISFYPLDNRPSLLADLSVTLKCVISQRLCKKPDGGRVPAVEVLLNSRYIAELIEKGDLGEIKDAMEKAWFRAARPSSRACSQLYSSGVITLDEALASADSANNLQQVINNAAAEARRPNRPPFKLDMDRRCRSWKKARALIARPSVTPTTPAAST